MKHVVLAVVCVVAASASGSAFAQSCPAGTTRITGGTLTNPNGPGNFDKFIEGATICAARGSDRWQEFHRADGVLIDWKLGSDPMDPTSPVGNWTAQNGANATVTHIYSSTSFVWAICRDSSGLTYTLVSLTGGTVLGATIRAGQGACP